jgi:hypothetical protein
MLLFDIQLDYFLQTLKSVQITTVMGLSGMDFPENTGNLRKQLQLNIFLKNVVNALAKIVQENKAILYEACILNY